MIAIETRYAGATNTKPSRIIATTENGQRHVITYQHALDAARQNDERLPHETESTHRVAATELAESMGWLKPGCRFASGSTKRGYVFVFVTEESK